MLFFISCSAVILAASEIFAESSNDGATITLDTGSEVSLNSVTFKNNGTYNNGGTTTLENSTFNNYGIFDNIGTLNNPSGLFNNFCEGTFIDSGSIVGFGPVDLCSPDSDSSYISMGSGNENPEDGSIAAADPNSGFATQISEPLSPSLNGIAFKEDGRLFSTNATHLFLANVSNGNVLNSHQIVNFGDLLPFAEIVTDLTADPAGSNQLDILSFNGSQYTYNILLEDGRVFVSGITSKCDQQVGSLAWRTPDSIIFTFSPATVSCPSSSSSGQPLMEPATESETLEEPPTWLVEREIIRGNPPSLGFLNIWVIDQLYDGLSTNSTGGIFATSDDGVYELDCIDGSPGSCTSTLVSAEGTNPDDIDFVP